MKDRIPTYPGRVKLVPVAGQANVYDMVRADEPVEAGTPLNKATLLTDQTATKLGLDLETATPDKAFEASMLNANCAIGDIIASNRKDFSPTLTKDNFLPCDGRTVSPDDYPELADAVGVFYGAAKITGTFTPLSIEKHNGQVYCARQYGSYVEVLRFNTSTLQFELFESETFKDHMANKAALCSRSNGELVLVTKNETSSIAYMYTMSTTGVWSFTTSISPVRGSSPWIMFLSEDSISKDLLLCMLLNSSSNPTYFYQYSNAQKQWISRNYENGLMYTRPLPLNNGGFVSNISQKIRKISLEGSYSVLLDLTESNRDVFVMSDGTIIGDGGRQYSKDDGQTWQPTTGTQGELISYVSLPDNSVLALYSGAAPEEMMRTYDGITWHKNGTPRGEYSEANGYCTPNGIIIQEKGSTYTRSPYVVYNSGVKLAELPNFYVRCK